MFSPVQRRKLFHGVARQIADAIRGGDYPRGSELPSEHELMQAFSVGRPAVREALLVLEAQGLVVIHHGRRARVADVQVQTTTNWIAIAAARTGTDPNRFVEDLKGLRLALEVAIAARAAEVASRRDIARLR